MRSPTSVYDSRLQSYVSRFLRARQELYLSLGQLSRTQKFYIIFYNDKTFPMYAPQIVQSMAPAATEHLSLAKLWIQNFNPGGGTDPQMAFQLALSLKPEVIFFLTDGQIPVTTRGVAKMYNKSRTRIHTIAFGIPTQQGILKAIAQDNQGRYRFVP